MHSLVEKYYAAADNAIAEALPQLQKHQANLRPENPRSTLEVIPAALTTVSSAPHPGLSILEIGRPRWSRSQQAEHYQLHRKWQMKHVEETQWSRDWTRTRTKIRDWRQDQSLTGCR